MNLDTTFALLKNSRRRQILDQLEKTGPTHRRNLVELIAATEEGVQPGRASRSKRECLYISLHQRHLPRLDEAGVLEYHRDGMVELTGEANTLLHVMDAADHYCREIRADGGGETPLPGQQWCPDCGRLCSGMESECRDCGASLGGRDE